MTKNIGKRAKKHALLYFLLVPGIIYYIIFRYIPLIGNIIAFKDIAPFEGVQAMMTSDWVGLVHFKNFFNSVYFWNIFGNTLKLAGYRLITEFPLAILLAIMINEIRSLKFKKTVQTISYMPYFISNVVLAGLVFTLFTADGGLVPEVVKVFGGQPGYYVGDVRYFRGILIGAITWKNVGWGTIIYLAAMAGIDPNLYEAASIDGAGKFRQIIHITLPGIAYCIVIMFILRIGVIMNQGFEETMLLYSPGVYKVADIIDTYVYRMGLEQLQYSFATAVGLFKSILGLILVLSTEWLAKKMGQQGLYN